MTTPPPGLPPLAPLAHHGPQLRPAARAESPRRADGSARHRARHDAPLTRDARPARAAARPHDRQAVTVLQPAPEVGRPLLQPAPEVGRPLLQLAPRRPVCVPFAVRADGRPEGVCNTPVIREERPLDTRPLHSVRPGFPGTPQPFGPRPRGARAFHHPHFSRQETLR